MCFILLLLGLPLFAITKGAQQCPSSHLYAYINGEYCCKYNREKSYRPQGWRCDGSVIGLTSGCCKDDAYTKCPSPPCRSGTPPGKHQCPADHPYAYNKGNHCCKYGQEKRYAAHGWQCDGGPIGLTSSCCKDDKYVKCATPPCAAPGDCNNYCGEITKDRHKFVKIEYHLNKAKKIPQGAIRPIAVKRLDNRRGSMSRSISFTVSETTSDTVSYSHTTGVSISSSVSFKAGVPFVAEGEISVEVSASYEYSTGKEYTKEKSMEASFVCDSPARKLTICKAYLNRVTIKVPYTQTWAVKRYPQCTCTTNGVFTGNDATELYMTVNEQDRIVARSATVKRSMDGYVAAEKLE